MNTASKATNAKLFFVVDKTAEGKIEVFFPHGAIDLAEAKLQGTPTTIGVYEVEVADEGRVGIYGDCRLATTLDALMGLNDAMQGAEIEQLFARIFLAGFCHGKESSTFSVPTIVHKRY